MKAVVIHAARDLRIEERDAGRAGPGQVEIAIEAGGICGSDLHYYQDGGFGAVRLREPMILGHEIAGRITALGAGVSAFAVGDRVVVSPSRPCNTCTYCLKGLQNQCLNMRFYGSAMVMPHIQGAFVRPWLPRAGNATPSLMAFRAARRPSRTVRSHASRGQPCGLACRQARPHYRQRADRGAVRRLGAVRWRFRDRGHRHHGSRIEDCQRTRC